MTSVSYYEAHDLFSSSKESFQAAQRVMTNSRDIEKTFSVVTEHLTRSLEGYFRIYRQRFETRFPGTRSRTLEGILWKKGQGLTKSWQRRYFVLKNGTLSYHHGVEDCHSPQGELGLLLTSVKALSSPGQFTIISPDKTYVLRAMTDYERDEWMCVIQNSIEHALNNSGKPSSQSHPSDATPTITIHETHCADCGCPNPTWCCINWGVCICIHCAGVHRGLTSTVSKVRSLTLDQLDASTLKIFEVIGNARANAILEPNAGDAKIKEGAAMADRDAFIQRKYAHREFAINEQVDLLKAVKESDYVAVFKGICSGMLRAEQGYTSLHCAASRGDPVMCLLLAYNMINPDALHEGWSPLAYAAFYEHGEVAKVLIDMGCVPKKGDAIHPYEIALSKHNDELAMIFVPFWAGGTTEPKTFTPPVPCGD
jgi:hypothetical protein